MKLPLLSLLLVASQFLSGCSPFYVMRAAYEQSKILIRREDIADVIEAPETPDDERQKLQAVVDAREFALSMGLTPKDSYTTYADIGKETLAWVLVAAKPDSFSLYTWWFPIVGTVPYKGYFDKEDADSMARDLERRGYESWVRGTDAISTLGWFNDPVLSTTLKSDPPRIVNTVIHEILHGTVWIPNHVDFNESLANFVGIKGMAQFYQARANQCSSNCEAALKTSALVCQRAQLELRLAAGVQGLFDELNALYQSQASKEEKLLRRQEIFNRRVSALRELLPQMTILATVNNAELIQLKLYMTELMLFEGLYRKYNNSWTAFLGAMREIAKEVGENKDVAPFELLAKKIGGPAPNINQEICR